MSIFDAWAWYEKAESPYGPMTFIPVGDHKVVDVKMKESGVPARYQGQETHDGVTYDVWVFDQAPVDAAHE